MLILRKMMSAAAVLSLAVATVAQEPQPVVSPQSRSEQIIQSLDLRPLAGEGGLRGVIGRTLPEAVFNGKPMAVQSRNYAMVSRAFPNLYLHRLESEETHILVEGGPVEFYVFCSNGHLEKDMMSRNFSDREDAVVAVPGGCWQAARLAPGVEYALMVSTQAPEWRSDRVTLGAGPQWVQRYVGKQSWATAEFLRALIGPGWRPSS